MNLADLFSLLKGIKGFENKVAYRCFPMGSAPDLPFICYNETNTDNFFADNKVFKNVKGVDIELYTENKDLTSEKLVEDTLNDACIPWQKYEQYIDVEKMYQITYSVEV